MVTLFSCKDINHKSDEYLVFNKVIDKLNTGKYNILIDISNNNKSIITKIKKLKNYNLLNDKYKSDSLKQILGIKKNEIFNAIFNPKNYNYLITQKSNSNWNIDNIISHKNKGHL